MPIPQRLRFDPVTDDVIREMADLCDEIEDALERGDDATVLLDKWHIQASRRCDLAEFATYWRFIEVL